MLKEKRLKNKSHSLDLTAVRRSDLQFQTWFRITERCFSVFSLTLWTESGSEPDDVFLSFPLVFLRRALRQRLSCWRAHLVGRRRLEHPGLWAHPVGGVTSLRSGRNTIGRSQTQRDVHPAPDHQREGEEDERVAWRMIPTLFWCWSMMCVCCEAHPGGGGQRPVRVQRSEQDGGRLQEGRSWLQCLTHHAAVRQVRHHTLPAADVSKVWQDLFTSEDSFSLWMNILFTSLLLWTNCLTFDPFRHNDLFLQPSCPQLHIWTSCDTSAKDRLNPFY